MFKRRTENYAMPLPDRTNVALKDPLSASKKTGTVTGKFEEAVIHPAMSDWLANNGFSFHHEVPMPLMGVADFIAYDAEGNGWVIECKIDCRDIQKTIAQVIGYRHQLDNFGAVIAAPEETITVEAQAACAAYQVTLLALPVMARRRKYRMQHKFWLNLNSERELRVAEWLEQLKVERRYMPTLLESLELMADLRAGRMDMLITLFPHLFDRER